MAMCQSRPRIASGRQGQCKNLPGHFQNGHDDGVCPIAEILTVLIGNAVVTTSTVLGVVSTTFALTVLYSKSTAKPAQKGMPT